MSLGFITRWRPQDVQTPAIVSSGRGYIVIFFCSFFFPQAHYIQEEETGTLTMWGWQNHTTRPCRVDGIIVPFFVKAIRHKMNSREIEIYIFNWIFLLFPSRESTSPNPLIPIFKIRFSVQGGKQAPIVWCSWTQAWLQKYAKTKLRCKHISLCIFKVWHIRHCNKESVPSIFPTR